MPCPSENEIADVLAGHSNLTRADQLFQHFESCDSCHERVERIEKSLKPNRLDTALKVSISADTLAGSERLIQKSLSFDASGSGSGDYLEHITQIRDYQLGHSIGAGGMGRVFRATHRHLKRDVAIKVLSPRRFGNHLASQRFRQEMATGGQLDHPNIVRTFDAGEHDGIPYLVMELVQGVDLATLIDGAAPLRADDAAFVTWQVAEALAYAHSKGVIHRDVKPSNILVTRSGRVRIMDFGLALVEQSEADEPTFVGSIEYMAPEQSQDARQVDARADIFSLGCTLYQMLTGQSPFPVDREQPVSAQLMGRASIVQSNPPSLEDLPKPLADLVARMLNRHPDERPDATEVARLTQPLAVAHDTQAILRQVPALQNEMNDDSFDSHRPPLQRHQRAQRRAILTAMGTATLLMATIAYSIFVFTRSEVFSSGSDLPSATTHPPSTTSIAPQFANIPSDNFTTVSTTVFGTIDERKVQLKVAPGFGIRVQFEASHQQPAKEYRSWDLLELKLKHPDAFEAYDRFLPTLASQADVSMLFPFKMPPDPPVEQLTTQLVTEAGIKRAYGWSSKGSARLTCLTNRNCQLEISEPGEERSFYFALDSEASIARMPADVRQWYSVLQAEVPAR